MQDGLERMIYNTMLASLDPGGDGEVFLLFALPAECEEGLLPQEMALLLGHAGAGRRGLRDQRLFPRSGFAVRGPFHSSEVGWVKDGVPIRLVQTTRYPDDGTWSHCALEMPRPVAFSLKVRIPGWLSAPSKFK